MKWIAVVVTVGLLGKLAVVVLFPAGAAVFRTIDRQFSYKFDRPIASVFEFQTAILLRGMMVQDHCPAFGFDLNERRFFAAAERLGFPSSQALHDIDLNKVHASLEKVLPRNPTSGNVTCQAMFDLLNAAVPGGVENVRGATLGEATYSSKPQPRAPALAAKNMYLAAAASSQCPLIVPKKEVFAAYARDNGVELSDIRQTAEGARYADQRRYAEGIVRSHVELAGKEALCKALLADFGPGGKLAKGLLEENMFGDLIPPEGKAPF